MDPQFRELADEITRSVSAAVMHDVAEALKQHVTDVVAAAEDRLTRHVDGRLHATEERLSEQARVNVEAVKDQAKLAAEGYAGTLDGIQRDLTEIKSVLRTRFEHDDGVLANHNTCITTLEQKSQ